MRRQRLAAIGQWAVIAALFLASCVLAGAFMALISAASR